MQQERQRDGPLDDVRKVHNLLLVVGQVGATPLEVLMRKPRTMGSRYPIHWSFPVGMLVTAVVCGQAGWVGIVYAGLVWVMWLLHLFKRDKTAHSMYCGRSWLGTGRRVYSAWEPALFTAAGGLVFFLSPVVGSCMVVSALCSAGVFGHLNGRDAARLRALRDRTIEQQVLMEEFQRERPQ